jgi:hypothetical protein
MRIMVGDKIFSSADEPIMVLFDSGENTQFRTSQPNTDIFCSWPSTWDRKVGEGWMQANQSRLVAPPAPVIMKSEKSKKIDQLLSDRPTTLEFPPVEKKD